VRNDQDVEASTIMLKLWGAAYIGVVLICGGFATYVFLQMSSPSAMGQTAPPATGPTPAATPAQQAGASTTPENYSLPIPVAEVSKMYNAISQDETELRNVLVAIPILLTILLAFAPFALGNFVTVRVSEAVKDRVGEAEAALKEARAMENRIETKLLSSEANVSLKIAYIYWNLRDLEQSVLRAQVAIDKSNEALKLLKAEPPKDAAELEKVEQFRLDALDSWAYYVAELFVERGEQKLDKEDYVKAKDRGIEMLDRLKTPTARPIDSVDNCLFVVWAFRDHIESVSLARALELFRSQRIPLRHHKWDELPEANYRKYVDYYEQELGTLTTAT
jgi:hypothetical protein